VPNGGPYWGLLSVMPAGGPCEELLPVVPAGGPCRELFLYQSNMKYYMKTGIAETGITGVGTLKTGMTGGFPLQINEFNKCVVKF
jgi:hypothetical protein